MAKRLSRLIVDFSREPVILTAKRRGARGGLITHTVLAVPRVLLKKFLADPEVQADLLLPQKQTPLN